MPKTTPRKQKPRRIIASRVYQDRLTGATLPKSLRGTYDAGRFVAKVRPRKGSPLESVEIDREDLGVPLPDRYEVDAETAQHYREEARQQAKRRKPRKATRIKKTFPSYAKAAATFYDENDRYFEHIAEPREYLREWLDEAETYKRGKFAKTKAAREMMATRSEAKAIKLALRFVFSKARKKRWDAVPWGDVDRLLEFLHRGWQVPGGEEGDRGEARQIVWWPPGSGREDKSMMDEYAGIRSNEIEELEQHLANLRKAYRQVRGCLNEADRSIVLARIRVIRRWVDDPEKAERSLACELDQDSTLEGQTRCFFPRLEREIGRVRVACESIYNSEAPKIEE